MKSKQELELLHTRLFLESANVQYADLKSCSIDPPDVSFKLSDGTSVGLEHTLLYRPKGGYIKSVYDTYMEVVDLARDIFVKENRTPLFVYFKFDGKLDTKKGAGNSIAKELCDLVILNLSRIDFDQRISKLCISSEELPNYLEELKIIWRDENKVNRWKSCDIIDVVFSSEIPVDQLTKRINYKNQKLLKTEYGKNFNETWLLVIVEGSHWSNFIVSRPEELENNWKFDKIFVFGLKDDNWVKLK